MDLSFILLHVVRRAFFCIVSQSCFGSICCSDPRYIWMFQTTVCYYLPNKYHIFACHVVYLLISQWDFFVQVDKAKHHYENLLLSSACESILEIGNLGNLYIDEQAPWSCFKKGGESAEKAAKVNNWNYCLLSSVFHVFLDVICQILITESSYMKYQKTNRILAYARDFLWIFQIHLLYNWQHPKPCFIIRDVLLCYNISNKSYLRLEFLKCIF